MNSFIQLYDRKLDDSVGEALGSDAVYKLDARHINLDMHVAQGHIRAHQLRNVHVYEGFRVFAGNLWQAHPVTEFIRVQHD